MNPVVILAGGRGTRLRAACGRLPKPLAPVAGIPFAGHLLRLLARCGFRSVTLAVGYRANDMRRVLGDGRQYGVRLRYAVEPGPRGTAGALRHALPAAPRRAVLVLNGDSFTALNPQRLLAFHYARRALVTIAAVRVPGRARYGALAVGRHGAVRHFAEKRGHGGGIVNAGMYVFSPRAWRALPREAASLENGVFPALAGRGLHALVTRAAFADIGTPAAYRRLLRAPQPLLRLSGRSR